MNAWSMRGGGVRGCRTLQVGGGLRDSRSRSVQVGHHRIPAYGLDGYNADAIPECHCTVGVNVGMSTGRGGVIQEIE